MERKKSARWWLIAAGVPLLGCMSLTHYERTIVLRGDEPRRAVAFESPLVAEQFAGAVRERWNDDSRQVRTDRFGVLFLCCYSQTASLSDNAFYNDQVRACDLDGNGLITEAEVQFYRQNGDGTPCVKVKHFGPVRVKTIEPPPALLPPPTLVEPMPEKSAQ